MLRPAKASVATLVMPLEFRSITVTVSLNRASTSWRLKHPFTAKLQVLFDVDVDVLVLVEVLVDVLVLVEVLVDVDVDVLVLVEVLVDVGHSPWTIWIVHISTHTTRIILLLFGITSFELYFLWINCSNEAYPKVAAYLYFNLNTKK